jgi:hypothetical protein
LASYDVFLFPQDECHTEGGILSELHGDADEYDIELQTIRRKAYLSYIGKWRDCLKSLNTICRTVMWKTEIRVTQYRFISSTTNSIPHIFDEPSLSTGADGRNNNCSNSNRIQLLEV